MEKQNKTGKKLVILTAIMLLSSSLMAKTGFEYGGTTLFLENTQYLNGYDGDGEAMEGRNMYQTTRTYLTGYYNINDLNKIRLTLDSGTYGDKDSSGFKSDNWVYIKYLYLESKGLLSFDKVKIGQIGTPWIGFEDKIWGYRMLSKSLLDVQKNHKQC